MGYRIVYGQDPAPRRLGRVRAMTACFLLVFLLGVRWTWPEGTALLRRTLIPGEPAVSAFSRMVEEIQVGTPVGEAVTAFCREVVAHGLAAEG